MSSLRSEVTFVAGLMVLALVSACAGPTASAPPGSANAPTLSDGSPTAGLTPSPATSAATPSPTPVASRNAIPPLSQAFHSPTMGYTVRYPDGWTVTKASEPWRAGASEFWDDPNGDRIESAEAGFRGGSQKLAPGQAPEAWLDAYLADSPSCGVREEIPLGGSRATIDLNGCPGLGRLGGRVYDVVVVIGSRGYNFTMEGDVDHELLIAMLATVTFDPASAVD